MNDGRLLFVSAGLSESGGGIAAAGRLLLGATRQWAAARGAHVRVLTLGDESDIPRGMDGEAFAGNRGALARAVWRSQLFEGYRHHVYDFLGVARIQGMLPQRLQARYLLYLYGIECWRPLDGTRRRAVSGASVRLASSEHTILKLRRENPEAPIIHPLHLALAERPAGGPAAHAATLAGLAERFVLIVGRLAPGERYKGHDELIGAMARLATSHPDLQLVIAGSGEDRARLAELAASTGVGGGVLFTGYVSDATLSELYERCTVFAMPSHGEGFGFVYLEAMRAGKPCIALAESSAAEIVIDGATGRLVEPGVAPLVAALAELLDDPERASALGAAGRRRWEERFLPARFAADLEPYLEGLVAVARRQPAATKSTTPSLLPTGPRTR